MSEKLTNIEAQEVLMSGFGPEYAVRFCFCSEDSFICRDKDDGMLVDERGDSYDGATPWNHVTCGWYRHEPEEKKPAQKQDWVETEIFTTEKGVLTVKNPTKHRYCRISDAPSFCNFICYVYEDELVTGNNLKSLPIIYCHNHGVWSDDCHTGAKIVRPKRVRWSV